jgi:uncharacterized hydrophobic protein (TIGR00271 family)
MSHPPVEPLAAILGQKLEMDVTLQFDWAIQLGRSLQLDILMFDHQEDSKDFVEEIHLDAPAHKNEGQHAFKLRETLGSTPRLQAGRRPNKSGKEESSSSCYLRLKTIHYSSWASLRRLLLKELIEEKAHTFTMLRPQLGMKDADPTREWRLLLRYMPCQMVLCQGLTSMDVLSNVLVEAPNGPNGKAALQLGRKITEEVKGTMTALYVNPDVGTLSKEVGEKRLQRNIEKAIDTGHSNIRHRVMVDNHSYAGVQRAWQEGQYGIIMAGAHLLQFDGSLGTKFGKVPTIIVTASSPLANHARKFLDEAVQRIIPQIGRKDRIDLVDRLQSSASWNFDFAALMILSSTIAAIGLLQNSAAVVIGAMLVAPLMTPLLGLGLGMVQGNAELARLSIRSIILGVCVSLLGGFIVGLLTLGDVEPTREMLARGRPGLLDVFVAFASGLAAAYASTRTNLIAALPGVAIAAALVPPIATSGLAFALGNIHLAISSLMIFIINMIVIILASMATLWAVGIRNTRTKTRWMVLSGNALFVMVTVLCLYLTFKPAEGQLTKRQMPAGLPHAVQQSLGPDFHLTGIALAYDELGAQLHISVEGVTPPSEALAKKVRKVANNHYSEAIRVRLLTMMKIDLPAKNPDVDESKPIDETIEY